MSFLGSKQEAERGKEPNGRGRVCVVCVDVAGGTGTEAAKKGTSKLQRKGPTG